MASLTSLLAFLFLHCASYLRLAAKVDASVITASGRFVAPDNFSEPLLVEIVGIDETKAPPVNWSVSPISPLKFRFRVAPTPGGANAKFEPEPEGIVARSRPRCTGPGALQTLSTIRKLRLWIPKSRLDCEVQTRPSSAR